MAEFCASLGVVGKFIARRKVCVLLLGAVLLLGSAVGASMFMSITTLSFEPPKGYPSYTAIQAMKKAFPDLVDSSEYAGLIAVKPPAKVLDLAALSEFSVSLNQSLNKHHPLVSFVSHATLSMQGIPAPDLVSKDNTTTLFQWVVDMKPTTDAARSFADTCEDVWKNEIQRWLPADQLDFSGVTSLTTITNAGIRDSETSLAEMDAIALPLAVLVLWYVLQSGRLLLFPLLTVAASASMSFGSMYLVGLVIPVQTTTPSLMMSILIAMSIDYSLFFLTRFRHELISIADEDETAKVTEAICTTMQTAGFTILLSGATLTTSFIIIAFFPIDMISSLGLGCAISLVIVIAVHMTLGPALLACFPAFFARSVAKDGVGSSCNCCKRRRRRAANESAQGLVDTEARSPVVQDSQGGDAAEEASDVSQGGSRSAAFWRTMAKFTTHPVCAVFIIVVIVAATLAVGYPVLGTKIGDNLLMSTPRGTPVYKTYDTLIHKFGAGAVNPYRVLMTLKEGEGFSVLSQTAWDDSQRILEEFQKLQLMDGASVQGMSYARRPFSKPMPVSWKDWQDCEQGKTECRPLQFAVASFKSKDSRSTFGSIALNWDPLGVDGHKFLDDARDLLADLEKKTCFTLHLDGIGAETFDTITKVYGLFPYMIAFTLVAALLLLGIAFRSIIMPLRSVVSICLTLILVYGLAARVYQHGEFDWLGMPGVSGKYGSEMWLLPIICFSIVVGICLDYDIFLLARVTEFRESKMSAREAIEEGLCTTGGIISAAGLIMAIAFAGLLFSSLLVVNGLAFFMVTAVLYDTLIVRCLLTPAVMGLLDRLNWWPSGLARKNLHEVSDEDATPAAGAASATSQSAPGVAATA